MKKIKVVAKSVFVLAIMLAYAIYLYGVRDGIIAFGQSMIFFVFIAIASLVIFRLTMGSWDLRKIQQKTATLSPEQSAMQTQKSYEMFNSDRTRYVGMALVAIVVVLVAVVIILKTYLYFKTGSWWLQ